VLTRSFSDDPAAAGALAAGFIRGAQQAGLAATAKHFPGLGDCRIDSHIDLPRIPHHSSRFRTLELTPFRAAIAAGAALVMTAHVAVPGLTGDDCPASLSRVVITDLLRGELGFSGVVVSDALEMGGISRQMNVPEAAVRALHAGTDIALCCRSAEDLAAVLAALRTAVADGRLPEEELAASRERIQRLRQRFGAPRAQPVALAKSPADLSRQIANRAVWRRQDPAGLLPITSSDPPWQALWLGRAMGSAVSDQEPLEAQPLIKRLAEAGIRTEAIENLAAAAPDKPLLVLETNLHLEPHCSEVVDKLAGHSAPVLLVSFEVPLPQQLVPANITALAVFHGSQICQLAAADVLLGCERPLGRSPFAADGYLA